MTIIEKRTKKVKLDFYKKSGKWYTTETANVSGIGDFLDYKEMLRVHEIYKKEGLYLVITDIESDKKPYVVPQMFPPEKVEG